MILEAALFEEISKLKKRLDVIEEKLGIKEPPTVAVATAVEKGALGMSGGTAQVAAGDWFRLGRR